MTTPHDTVICGCEGDFEYCPYYLASVTPRDDVQFWCNYCGWVVMKVRVPGTSTREGACEDCGKYFRTGENRQ
jgi:hypothetical protein